VSLSRKRKKELKRLKNHANDLWQSQQEILDHANAVAREAGRQLGNYSREQVAPVVRGAYDQRLAPVVDRGVKVTHKVADEANRAFNKNVLPAVGTALGAVLSVGDIAKDTRVRSALNRLQGKPPVKKGPGAGTVIAIGVGVVAAAGVAYAVWQTFRADDELWVAEEEPVLPNL
jgi:hypothetical protein